MDEDLGEIIVDAPFHRSIFNQPLTYKALRRLALAIGWSENKTQGKGSHRTLTRKGYREVTLPCHSENHEYQRGQTRKFLKQILEPLADVCHVPVQGIHTVEQIEIMIAELLEYLPTQVQREYEQAIAEAKSTLEIYEADQRSKADERIQQYEEQRLQDCDKTIRDLESERQQSESTRPWMGQLILQQACLSETLNQEYQSTLAQLKTSQAEQQQHLVQLQSIETDNQALKQTLSQQEAATSQLNQSLKNSQNQIKRLQQNRKRDRILMLGFLGLSVCLGVVLVHREVSRPRSPQSLLNYSDFYNRDIHT